MLQKKSRKSANDLLNALFHLFFSALCAQMKLTSMSWPPFVHLTLAPGRLILVYKVKGLLVKPLASSSNFNLNMYSGLASEKHIKQTHEYRIFHFAYPAFVFSVY